MQHSTNHNSTTKPSNFRRFLSKIVTKASHNPHRGDKRSEDLKNELSRIRLRVHDTLDKINKEAEVSETPDDDARVQAKLEKTMQVLTDEMMLLAAQYHRQKDVTRIKRFLNDQRDVIRTSMNSEDGSSDEKKLSLDRRIVELHKLMAAERQRIHASTKNERVKFWITFTLALLSLSVSIYALSLR